MGLKEAREFLNQHEHLLSQNGYEEIFKRTNDEKVFERFLKNFIDELEQTIEILERSSKFDKARELRRCETVLKTSRNKLKIGL